jgi:hypothetical protein
LYNFLRIDVALQITGSGTFTVRVVLKDDLDLAVLTEASATTALGPGAHLLPVVLDGPDIYNGGVDGPYFAHLTLTSESGTVLATGVHRTAAYGFADFQAYAARIVPPASERALDNDTDRLTDWIDLSFTLDIATADSYTLTSLLTDATYTISLAPSNTAALAPGRVTLHQMFPGYPIRLAARNGPYLVTNTLYDGLGNRVDFLFLETAAYSYEEFEPPPILFAPPHSEQAIDSDGDGLINALRIDASVAVEVAGAYTLLGRLVATDGRLLRDTIVRLNVLAGARIASVTFEGAALYNSGVDGPYRLDLELYDAEARRLDTSVHWTASYVASQFEPQILFLDPPFLDAGVDADADGRFEALRVRVPMEVLSAASVRIEASLREGLSTTNIDRVVQPFDAQVGASAATVDFAGPAIAASGIDGPYRVWVSVFDGQGTLVDEANERTAAYLASDFQSTPVARILGLLQEAGEDLDGDGSFNRLRIRVEIDASSPGRYRAHGTLSHEGAIVTEAESVTLVPGGTSSIDLVFGGPDLRAAGQDGPYDVRVSLMAFGAALTLAEATLRTAPHAAASFEAAAPASLAGRVRSEFGGAPLEGASVWAIDYVNHVSRHVPADDRGVYSIPLPEGTYWVVVDHPRGQAKAWSQSVSGATYADVSLGFPRRLLLEDDVVWTGWDRVLLATRYVYATDAPALPFYLDWADGDRDGRVEASEYASLPMPADSIRELIDAGTTSERLTVNGIRFDAVDAPVWSDGLAGEVNPLSPPSLRIARSYTSSWPIGEPPRVQVTVETLYDTMTIDRRTRLFLPNAWRFASATDDPAIMFLGRKIPYTVDPDLPEVPSSGFRPFEVLLLRQSSYVRPTPGAPIGLQAAASGTAVMLAWRRPTANTDGTPLANLAGYHVYRRTSAEWVLARVTSQLATTEAYHDGGVSSVGTFVYAVTAVNTDGVEGPLSDTVAVTISGYALSVSVVDDSGAGVGGATLELWNDRGDRAASALTDDGGRARLVAPPGEYTLVVAGLDVVATSLRVLHLSDASVVVSVSRLRAWGPPLLSGGLALAVLTIAAIVAATLRVSRRRAPLSDERGRRR